MCIGTTPYSAVLNKFLDARILHEGAVLYLLHRSRKKMYGTLPLNGEKSNNPAPHSNFS